MYLVHIDANQRPIRLTFHSIVARTLWVIAAVCVIAALVFYLLGLGELAFGMFMLAAIPSIAIKMAALVILMRYS